MAAARVPGQGVHGSVEMPPGGRRRSSWSLIRAALPLTLAVGAACLGCAGHGAPGADAGGAADAAGPDAAACPGGPERDGPYTRVTVVGDPSALGLIDPSVVYPAGADTGLMTYTTVPDVAHVRIAIADSTDHGASWHYVGDVTRSQPITVTTTDTSVCGASSCDGNLVDESSSLVVDDYDPDPARRLKVFTHTYFYGADRHLELGYIAMQTAAAPEGPWTETRLFGWDSSSAISTTGVAYDINSDPALPELHGCLIVGEPGALVRAPGTIDLALSCVAVAGSTATIDIRLLRSLDHGRTWGVVGTLLAPEDAPPLGATSNQILGGDLFYADGAYHLIASPMGQVDFPDGAGDGYRGCVVVPIADLDAAEVARCDGAPVVEAAYRGQPGQFVGACSADVGASVTGMLIPVPSFTSSQPFQLFGSGLPLP